MEPMIWDVHAGRALTALAVVVVQVQLPVKLIVHVPFLDG